LGFLSRNRASTDALNALEGWKAAASGRSYVPVVDADEELVADIVFAESDAEAGPEMGRMCMQHGVRFEPAGSKG
jgi:hypothetical protein